MMILGRRTEQHVIIAGFLLRHWLYECFSRVEETEQHVIIGFGELAGVD